MASSAATPKPGGQRHAANASTNASTGADPHAWRGAGRDIFACIQVSHWVLRRRNGLHVQYFTGFCGLCKRRGHFGKPV